MTKKIFKMHFESIFFGNTIWQRHKIADWQQIVRSTAFVISLTKAVSEDIFWNLFAIFYLLPIVCPTLVVLKHSCHCIFISLFEFCCKCFPQDLVRELCNRFQKYYTIWFCWKITFNREGICQSCSQTVFATRVKNTEISLYKYRFPFNKKIAFEFGLQFISNMDKICTSATDVSLLMFLKCISIIIVFCCKCVISLNLFTRHKRMKLKTW